MMLIKKLILSNNNNKQAKIEFSDGINIISGVSNTGKTFIYQCINYILCSDKLPKDIEEARDYNDMFLEIEIYNEVFTIKRVKGEKKVLVYNGTFDTIDHKECKELFAQQDKTKENLSAWLLGKIHKEKEIQILKNKSETRALTFRDILHFCSASEQEIISECSPFFTEEFINKTSYKSVFNYLLTGIDQTNKEKKDAKKNKISKAVMTEILNNQINDLNNRIQSIKNKIDNNKKDVNLIDCLNNEIKGITLKISELNKKNHENNLKINEGNIKLVELISQKDSLSVLMNNYEEQLNEFKTCNNFSDILQRLPEYKCPLCKQIIKDENITNQELSEINDFYQDKYNNIYGLKIQLQKTIDELVNKIKIQEDNVDKIKSIVAKDQKRIYELSDQLKKKNNDIQDLKDMQLNILKLDFYTDNVNMLINKKNQLKNVSDNKLLENKVVADDDLNAYCKILSEIIENWTGEHKIIRFDKESNDIKVDGEQRKNFGKGFRAFYSSAMLIALQRYLSNKDRIYPGFVVIDSPLVSLKEQTRVNKNELIDDYMQSNMIEDLINHSDLGQVIIFENKDFDKYKNKINYIYYSQANIDGFIPQ